MAEKLKKALCGLCTNHCRVDVRIRDGELVGIEPPAGTQDSPAAKRQATIIRGCVRAIAAREFFYHPMRLNYPLKRAGERGQNR